MSRCYVGALPPDPPEEELSRVFEGAGEIHDVQVKKTISGDWYAFVHYKDPDAADEAIRRFDGFDFHGSRLRVELPFASDKRSSLRRPQRRPYPSSGRVTVRVIGIPHSGSWQDLKDHFRGAGDCIFADTYGDGTGIVEYTAYEEAQRAVGMFDNSVFKSHQGESSRIQLEILAPGRGSSSSWRSRPYESSGSYGGRYYDDYEYEDRRYRSYRPRRSPPRRPPPRYGRSSPGAHRVPAAIDPEDRYTTQDSRSTEAFSQTAEKRPKRHSDNSDDDHWRGGGGDKGHSH